MQKVILDLKKNKVLGTEDLLIKKQAFKDFVKFSIEKNQAVLSETYKNLLFSFKI